MVLDSDMPGFVVTSRVQLSDDTTGWPSNMEALPDRPQPVEFRLPTQQDAPERHEFDPECTCENCEKERVYKKASSKAKELGERTRLHDDGFYNDKTMVELHLPFEVQHRLLCKAYRLAQASFFHAILRFDTKRNGYWYGRGPSGIRFESGHHPNGWEAGLPDSLVQRKIANMICFRNNISHPTDHEVKWLDTFMFWAQDLAVVMQDERRASRLRSLRDEVHSMALKEIERFGLYASDLSNRDWPFHHQRLCEQIVISIKNDVDDPDRYQPCKEIYGEVLLDIARAWKLRYLYHGRKREDFKLNKARKLSYLRDAGRGRRASVSIIQKQPAAPDAPEQDDHYALAKDLFGSGEEDLIKLKLIEALDLSVPVPVPMPNDISVGDSGAMEEYPQFKKPKIEDSPYSGEWACW